jgi:hypothetical protein
VAAVGKLVSPFQTDDHSSPDHLTFHASVALRAAGNARHNREQLEAATLAIEVGTGEACVGATGMAEAWHAPEGGCTWS